MPNLCIKTSLASEFTFDFSARTFSETRDGRVIASGSWDGWASGAPEVGNPLSFWAMPQGYVVGGVVSQMEGRHETPKPR